MPSILAFFVSLVCAAAAAQPKPTVVYERLLNGTFYPESARVMFDGAVFAFAPESPLNAEVLIVDAEGTVLARHPFWDTYTEKEGVFGAAKVKYGPHVADLPGEGLYNIVYMIDGEPATRLPIRVDLLSGGDDAFNPEKTYKFTGPWNFLAYLAEDEFNIDNRLGTNDSTFLVHLWTTNQDVEEGKRTSSLYIQVFRGDELIGHTITTGGSYSVNGSRFGKKTGYGIRVPHEVKDEANAPMLLKDEWLKDGEYTIVVTRQSDNRVLRRFGYTAKDGDIVRLPSTEIGFEPRTDYIVPRWFNNAGAGAYEEAIWITTAE
ncbi:MAG: hypothetical protein AAF937_07580 [Planctomycetota bacterium]